MSASTILRKLRSIPDKAGSDAGTTLGNLPHTLVTHLNLIDSCKLHSPLRLRIRHEPVPYIAAAQILSAQQRHAHIETQSVGGDPPGEGIEGIGDAVLAPYLVPIPVLHGVYRRNANVRRNHQRATRRVRNHAPINRRVHRWTAPCPLALRA